MWGGSWLTAEGWVSCPEGLEGTQGKVNGWKELQLVEVRGQEAEVLGH